MKLSETVKPISYFKSHASEIVREVADRHMPVVITLNGEAKAVLQDIREYEKDRETMALLKILALSRKSMGEGKAKAVGDAFREIRKKVKEINGR